MRHVHFKIFVLFLTICLIQSCRKEVPKGQIITANGIIMDFTQQKPIPSATIYLFGGHNHVGTGGLTVYYDTIPLASVTSDANGNFSLKYSAEGKSDDYALGVAKNYLQPSNIENILPDPYQTLYKFNYAYFLKDITISARELHALDITVKVSSNPYDTLLFRIYSASSGQAIAQYLFYGQSIDTILQTRYLPLSLNVFEYSVRTLNLIDSGYTRIASDTLSAGNVDTTFVSKMFNSTYEIPLKPY